jgi:type IV pilus assembly protein PilN
MIKVNLLPVKKKKKAKPVPAFILAMILAIIATGAVLAYLVYFFNTRLEARKAKVAENERTIAELREKIKAVEDYEKRNADYTRRKALIEQLGKNKALPVKVLDEISAQLPPGVWFTSLNISGADVGISCTGFTNTDVVNYVNNLKGSKMFQDVYLQESVQVRSAGFAVYNFSIKLKVKV